MVGKWSNTSAQITTITANNGGTGSFDVGSELTVYGYNESAFVSSINLQDNSIWEETDTGKHQIWNSTTNTWTEIA